MTATQLNDNFDAEVIEPMYIKVWDSQRVDYGKFYHSGDNLNSGNLHIEASIGGTFINWFSGGDVQIGNGNAGYGNINAASFTKASSLKLKKNINKSKLGLSDVLQLQPIEFEYRKDRSQKRHIGLVAEDVLKIIPEVVNELGKEGEKGIDYSELTVVLINAIKEIHTENNKLNNRIERLENKL